MASTRRELVGLIEQVLCSIAWPRRYGSLVHGEPLLVALHDDELELLGKMLR